MIRSKDRAGWFGASDTHAIMGSWNTKTFERFWLIKLGINRSSFATPAMQAGNAYEHKILDYIGVEKKDRQIKIRKLRLRVNLGGETNRIKEVKTHSAVKFRVTPAYWQQAQVEMFAAKKPLDIVSYHLLPDDYENYFNEIDPDRIGEREVEYDAAWIETMYLPRLRYLTKCLKKRKWPTMEEFENENTVR